MITSSTFEKHAQTIIGGLILASASTLAQASDKHPPKEPPNPPDSGLYVTNNDKAEHAVFGALFGLAGRLQFRENRWHALAVPAVVGLAKELVDSTQKGNRFGVKDLAATIAGGAIGVTMGDALIYMTRDSGVTRVTFATTF
jgi:uncharacterized protein YfiM (DUF2279 family)